MKRKIHDFLAGTTYRILGMFLGRFFKRPRTPLDPQKIVVLKPCCIGDVLMATATVAELRKAFPRAQLDFAVCTWSQVVIVNNQRIDKIIDCGPVGSGGPFTWQDYRSLVQKLKGGGYDACFVLERSAPLTLLPFLAGIPNRIGIDSGGRGFSLTHKVPLKTMRHEAELYLDLIRTVGFQPESPGLEFYPSEKDMAWTSHRLDFMASSGQADMPLPLVAIHPGGAANPGMTLFAKRWPVERYALLIERFLAEGFGIVLVGADSDRPLVDHLTSLLKNSRMAEKAEQNLLDLSGQTSLGQLGAVYKTCSLFIGNDTGPMHLAVACGIPVVAIFGPSTPIMYGPFGLNARAVYKKVDCSPCFLNGRYSVDCVEHKCMAAIEIDDVWSEAESLLRTQSSIRRSIHVSQE